MPEGQFTGSRKTYSYTMDSGDIVQLTLDETLGSISGAGLALSSGDDAGGFKPPRFKPRGVYWQGTLNGKVKRKYLTCNAGSSLYSANVSQVLNVDGVDGRTTGRRGETLSWSSNE